MDFMSCLKSDKDAPVVFLLFRSDKEISLHLIYTPEAVVFAFLLTIFL